MKKNDIPRTRRVLVTGVGGFVGSHVADHCLALGMEVVGIDDFSGGSAENVPRGVEMVIGDLRDASLVRSLWDRGPFNCIYHLAAYAAESLSHYIRRFNYENNLLASVNLLNEAVRHETELFVFVSSSAVYGQGTEPLTEQVLPRPFDPYGIAKYAFEMDLQAAHALFGIEYVIWRPHNIYGERQNIADHYRNVVGIFMNQGLRGEPMTVVGDGFQSRAFSHVDDVAPWIARSPLTPAARNQIFNIGAETSHTVLELAERVAAALGTPCRIRHLPARPEPSHLMVDHAKFRRIFGASEAVGLDEGIRKMAEWARGQKHRPTARFEGIEILRNLPDHWRPAR